MCIERLSDLSSNIPTTLASYDGQAGQAEQSEEGLKLGETAVGMKAIKALTQRSAEAARW